MSNKIKSSRGSIVDFDQIKIKQQLALGPSSSQSQAREEFIDQRLKRRLARKHVAQNSQTEVAGMVEVGDAVSAPELELIDETGSPAPTVRKQQVNKQKD